MITLIVHATERAHIKELLKKETDFIHEIATESLVSINVTLDVPFELSEEEETRHITRVILKSDRYKQVPITSREKVCVIGNFLKEGQAVCLALRKQGL